MWQGWVTAVLGVWLAVAPRISFDVPSVRLNNFFLGLLAAVVSGHIPIERYRAGWLGLAAGFWVAFSTFFTFFLIGDGYLWSNMISGVLIFTVGCLALARRRTEERAEGERAR